MTKIKKMKLTKEEIIYIAGIIDGEGCISLYQTKIKKKPNESRWTPRINITNTNLNLIKFLSKKLNSKIRTALKYNKHKLIYYIELNHLKVYNLCKLILPYLIVKYKQCKLMLEIQELMQTHPFNYQNRLYEILKEFRKLNKRGEAEGVIKI